MQIRSRERVGSSLALEPGFPKVDGPRIRGPSVESRIVAARVAIRLAPAGSRTTGRGGGRGTLVSQLPERINRLADLAHDRWWRWTPDARAVFRRLDYHHSRQTAHNPVRMRQVLPQEVLDGATRRRCWTVG